MRKKAISFLRVWVLEKKEKMETAFALWGRVPGYLDVIRSAVF